MDIREIVYNFDLFIISELKQIFKWADENESKYKMIKILFKALNLMKILNILMKYIEFPAFVRKFHNREYT